MLEVLDIFQDPREFILGLGTELITHIECFPSYIHLIGHLGCELGPGDIGFHSMSICSSIHRNQELNFDSIFYMCCDVSDFGF